jgi:hypothetical protein
MRFSAFSARCSAANRADSTRVRRALTCAHWSVSTGVGAVDCVVAFVELARFHGVVSWARRAACATEDVPERS